jgi:hypothetical protein
LSVGLRGRKAHTLSGCVPVTAEIYKLRRGQNSCGLQLHRPKYHITFQPGYKAWQTMLNRCRNQNVKDYPRYGGRGITVCERWNDYRAFLDDMGPRQKGMTVDRMDNDGNYEPSNCRWATPKEQAQNRRPKSVQRRKIGTR